MKGLIWIIVLFAIAVGAALLIQHFPGDVYAHVGNYMLRMNLRLFIIGLLLSMVVLYFLIKFVFGNRFFIIFFGFIGFGIRHFVG